MATETKKEKSASAGKPAATKRAKKSATSAAPTEHKLRIRVRAYEHKILDLSVKQIMETAARFDATIVGPVPLPIEVKRWTVNRSSFVHKDAREQFEMRIHKRLIDIMNPSPKVIEALTNLNLPSGVTIDVKMV
ncbi:30S ribosomal protein S10 [Candidatus Kaiserbacteria bacterium CG10_big_fil_rev_8_21_14_0_10_56_12]|uniref:Small ribosomal subunit protein uS10 n=1 Tax=Candidatus Kaiserbacteria bacterium CG10_big_fil_rev_8_21_14_0_10_56_12 TaxID=1974611 RepID=A0A2H0U9E0_9BACT|nr:MAG: 30S ribosomal protein S10 [Candidatus Kaiserbacteria bacterium CG10_big_fil_rev_8_21_14_0_10_56_12]